MKNTLRRGKAAVWAACAAITATTLMAQTQPAPKIRVGVMKPNAQLGPGSATAAESIRKSMMGYLAGPGVEVVLLDAMVPVQARAEATQKECDFVVAATVTQKKDGGGSGRLGFIKGAAAMSSAIPMRGAAHGAVGAVTGVAAGAALNGAAGAASYVKAKNEVTFDYHLISINTGAEVLAGSPKA